MKPYTDGTGVGVGIQSRSPVRDAAVHRRYSKFRILKNVGFTATTESLRPAPTQ